MSKHGTLAGEAYDTLEALKGTKYQAIFFFGPLHYAYYTIQEKFLNRGFLGTNLNVHIDSLYVERLMRGEAEIENYSDVAKVFMERQSILRADNVFSFSTTIRDVCEKHEIFLNSENFIQIGYFKNKFCQPFELPFRTSPSQINTLIFFGRLDQTAGLTTFVYAIEHLSKRGILGNIANIYVSGTPNKIFSF